VGVGAGDGAGAGDGLGTELPPPAGVDEPPELDDPLVVVEEEDPLPVAGVVATVPGLVANVAVVPVPDWNLEAAPAPQPHRSSRKNIARKGREIREVV
jgi:hypothetical protein